MYIFNDEMLSTVVALIAAHSAAAPFKKMKKNGAF